MTDALPRNRAVFTIDEIVAATRGRLRHAGAVQEVRGVFTDTRAPIAGGLFCALVGERFDAHDFVETAAGQGAGALLVARGRAALEATAAVVEVDDTLVALGDLAASHRRRFDAVVVAITGSVGKTSVKNMIAAVTACVGATLATSGNLNNLVGASLILLGLERGHRFAVLEIGTNRPGEIARLAAIAAPDVGLVTRIGASHLEGLGSIEGVRREKAALFRALDERHGVAVVNLADARVAAEGADLVRRVTYGTPEADVRLLYSRAGAPGAPPRIGVQTPRGPVDLQLRVLGDHQVDNAVAAMAVAIALEIDPVAAARALETVEPAAGRMVAVPRPDGGLLLDDSYNANPESMLSALDTLASVAERRRRVAVLGDMFELGGQADAAHDELGRAAVRAGVAVLLVCGPSAGMVAAGAIAAGLDPGAVEVFADSAAAAAQVRSKVAAGDVILVKGSRGMRMERVVQALTAVEG